MTIKIRRNEYKIHAGDYILDNGACWQLCAGDRRNFGWNNWDCIKSVIIPKSVLVKIDLSKFKATKCNWGVKYYFTEEPQS